MVSPSECWLLLVLFFNPDLELFDLSGQLRDLLQSSVRQIQCLVQLTLLNILIELLVLSLDWLIFLLTLRLVWRSEPVLFLKELLDSFVLVFDDSVQFLNFLFVKLV